MKTSKVLRKALEKLGPNGEHWIKGRLCGNEYLPVFHPEQCDFCAIGAICYVSDEIKDDSIGSLARYFLRIGIGSYCVEIVDFNDAPERTFPEIRAAFEKAIALAEADETGAA